MTIADGSRPKDPSKDSDRGNPVCLRKKFLTKLVPKGDNLEVQDYVEVPSYVKRLKISGPDGNIVLEGML